MRLLDTKNYELVDISEIPNKDRQYAILSHTWRTNYRAQGSHTQGQRLVISEVTYLDMKDYGHRAIKRLRPHGWAKLTGFCNFAASRGHKYVWMDTCCIDKTDPRDTTSSIHGMYEFYAYATVCYAYLAEVDRTLESWEASFMTANWFNRGWTLQELLAPRDLIYVDRNWREIGSRAQKGAPGLGLGDVLRNRSIWAQRRGNSTNLPIPNNLVTQLSWAAKRQTTVLEDQAYSICGLLQIRLHVDYEEGKNAFLRLQKGLIAKYGDISILAWFNSQGMLLSLSSCRLPLPSC